MSSEGLPLPVLFRRALEAGSKAYKLPTIQKETQQLLQAAVGDLRRVKSGIESLGLFSTNETLEDLATGDFIYLLAPYVLAELQSRLNIENEYEREEFIIGSQRTLNGYIDMVEAYSIVSEEEIRFARKNAADLDFSARRDFKIQQYRKEKDIRSKIYAIQKDRKRGIGEDADEFALIRSLLRDPSDTAEEDDDEIFRTLSLMVLKFYYMQSHSQLRSMSEEIQLLRQARRNEHPHDSGISTDADDTWKLDQPSRVGLPNSGPLMDSTGKPLRPFTILPSTTSSERARLRSEVFRPDYRLPTMTIDEYLEEENRRGNILSGGGPRSAEQLTSTEQLVLDSEMDGSAIGEAKTEEKRRKDEEWAIFTDNNPKGAGNTMNRG